MDIFHLKEEIENLEPRWRMWKNKLQAHLHMLEQKLTYPEHYHQFVALLKDAHDQAERAIKDPSSARGDIPWELSHGLSLLGMLDGRTPLPGSTNELKTQVLKDGSLLGCRKWELLDVRWTEALVAWLENLDNRATFGTTPSLIDMPDEVVLAIAGDWGTGPFADKAPSVLVASAMEKVSPDYTIHLGDVYYAGTQSEEGTNMAGWPKGRLGAFTLNSNHEMYNGAKSYFSELPMNFNLQQRTSYFALQNKNWLVVGLDSAYEADPLKLYMDGKLNHIQIEWLSSLPKDRPVIVFSHHQGYGIDGQTPTSLYQQVCAALGKTPAYWYWGHFHNAICYVPNGDFHGRCAGHGAIPYGNASELSGNKNIAWYETMPANDTNYPERVLNGFVKVTLKDAQISEQFIGEDGSVRWS